MKVVIIEDESLTAEDLADILKQLDSAIIIEAILPSVKKALTYFESHASPDLIFSDIQLQDGLSFDIFQTINIGTPVIFCTAYDEYALEAFKNNGVEYILKPFTGTSVGNAIAKYRQLKENFARKEASPYNELSKLLNRKLFKKESSLLVYQKEKIIPLDIDEIALCYVKKNLTLIICFDQRNFTINHTLDELEVKCGNGFYRANRQYLVNRKAIKEILHYYGRKLLLKLSVPFKDEIMISKAKATAFLQWLSNT